MVKIAYVRKFEKNLKKKKSNFITSKLSLVAHEVKIKNAKFVKMSADTRLKKNSKLRRNY